MRLTIKNLKTLNTPRGSAFSCTVYFDGVKVGTAHNGGYGGCDDLDIPAATINEINAYAKTLPPITQLGDYVLEKPLEQDISTLIGDAIEAYEDAKRLPKRKAAFKKKLAKEVVLVKVGTTGGISYKRTHPSGRDQTAGILAHAAKENPEHVILNNLPDEEAFRLASDAGIV